MSIESLLATEPSAMVFCQRDPRQSNDAGLPLNQLDPNRYITGRAVLSSTRQIAAWQALGVEANYEFITLDPSVQNGDFIFVSNRLFRVVGTHAIRYTKGSIPEYSKYPLLEERFD